MAKKILAAFLALIMMLSVLAFVGCDGQGDTDNGGDAQQPSGDNNDNTDIPNDGNEEEGGTTEDEGYKPRGDEYVREGDIIYFGKYPQSEVTDDTLKTTLAQKAGTLPTAANAQSWTAYGYYVNASNTNNYMWYIDVTEGEDTYRGVYFTKYRPDASTGSSPSQSNAYQYKNGYRTNNVYWFKYEPVAWRIIKESNGTALLLCDMIIDAQSYQDMYESRRMSDGSYKIFALGTDEHANSYEASTIRKWLNETFYDIAFDEYQKALIKVSTVDNSVASTGFKSNDYICDNTEDKVFLMSREEMTNMDLGFNSDVLSAQPARQRKASDYSKSQGLYTYTLSDFPNTGSWWLRSPGNENVLYGGGIRFDGVVSTANTYIDSTMLGVVPALQITLFK